MNKLYTFFSYILILVFTGINSISAQDIMDVPPFNNKGEPNLANAIYGDTLPGGIRANPNRIYRLQRGQVYLVDKVLFAKFPLRIIADNTDTSLRPPILVKGKYSNGVNIERFVEFTANGLSHYFKNIIFQGVDIDRKYFEQWNRGMKVSADNVSVTLEGCVINAFAGLAFEVIGKDCSLYFRDNVWRNGVYKSHQFGGQQNIFFTRFIDTLVVTNNTFFNNGGFWLFQENGVTNYSLIEHNTLFTSVIDLLRMRDMTNTTFRSNLFYGTHAYGQNAKETTDNWFDVDKQNISVFTIDTLGKDLAIDAGLNESERFIKVTNNSYFFPQKYHAFWESFSGVKKPVWMNTRTLAMFGDKNSYPKLINENNVNADPIFTDTEMVNWVTDAVIDFSKKFRNGQTVNDPRNYDVHKGATDMLMLQWPLPELLTYTNQDLLSGGHDGLPVGDLNWYPAKRALYVENTVAVEEMINFGDRFHVIAYPNPIVDIFNLEFELKSDQYISIGIYNLNGTLLKNYYNKKINSGEHHLQLKLNDLNSGVYFVKIFSNEGIAIKKTFKN
jgi:hypothetical protein